MKEVWNFIKNLWLNKKTRALAILMLYFFFFVFVYFFISANQPTSIPKPELKGWEAFEQVKHYHYQIDMDKSIVATYHEKTTFKIDEVYYTLEDVPTDFDNYYLSFWNPQNLKKVIDASTLVSTNYLESKDTYQLYSDKAVTILPWKQPVSFQIEVYKKEDMIYKIIIEQIELPFHLEWSID